MAQAARALARAGLPPTPHLDLPVGPRPQVVDDDGYEVLEEVEDAVDVVEDEGEESAEDEGADAEADDEGGMVDDEGDVVMKEEEVEEGVPQANGDEEGAEEDEPEEAAEEDQSGPGTEAEVVDPKQPLLSLAERPRPKNLPKSTFLFPTPPQPELPLPFDEYHGPSIEPEASGSKGTQTPGAGSDKEEGDRKATPQEKGKKPYKRPKKEVDNDVPPHEAQCIARVDLTIGPITYPGTELWIGRFVPARLAQPKKQPMTKEEKAQRDKARREKRKLMELEAMRKAGTPIPPKPSGRGRPPSIPRKQLGPPPAPPVRPPVAGPSRPPAAPPVRPPARQGLDPVLIQRVNAAAARLPRLSEIIHKAAKSNATKEELAILGRVVARLGKGESIDGMGLGTPIPPPPAPPTVPTSVQARPMPNPTQSTNTPVRPPPPPPKSESLSPPPNVPTETAVSPAGSGSSLSAAPEDSDSEPDMTGPEQVGGGPLPEAAVLPPPEVPDASSGQTAAGPSAVPHGTTASQSNGPPGTEQARESNVAGQTTLIPPTTAVPPIVSTAALPMPLALASRTPMPVVSSGTPTGPSPVSVPNTMPPPPTTIQPLATAFPVSNPNAGPSQATAPVDPSLPPAPAAPAAPASPPRKYPLPPPFLYVAFKEMPHEKYLVPLGMQSYISRVGGDHVTDPPTPKPEPEPVPQAVVPEVKVETAPMEVSKPGDISKRTRQSLGRQQRTPEIKPPTPPPEPEPKLPTPPPEIPKSGLDPLPGMSPPAGTVLISTFLPATEWMQPDWKAMSKRLPFKNKVFDITPESSTVTDGPPSLSPPASPTRSKRQLTESASRPDKPALLNLAGESWISEDDDDAVHAVTIRMIGLDDRAWGRMKQVMAEVEQADVDLLAYQQPDLKEKEPEGPSLLDKASQPRLWESYAERKRSNFERLLSRVPARSFLHYRLPEISPDLVDASTDRWHQRPYPISTKPLYLTSPPPEGEEPVLEVELPAPTKKRRNEVETEVEFEMPVSLDQLDERVAAGAKKALGKKVGKLKMPKPPRVKEVKPEAEDPGVGRFKKRGVPGKICEGCAGVGLKVWRRGPGGPATLCNTCGSKYLDGTLGPLQAPSEPLEQAADGDTEGDTSVKMEIDQEEPPDAQASEKGASAPAAPPQDTGVATQTIEASGMDQEVSSPDPRPTVVVEATSLGTEEQRDLESTSEPREAVAAADPDPVDRGQTIE